MSRLCKLYLRWFLFMFLVSCAPAATTPVEPPFIEELASPLPTIAILEATIPGYPPPVTIEPPSTFVPFPTDIPPTPPVGSELTPFPTFPPPPTPTRIPGPTPTTLPLPTPADSAVGNILYTVRESESSLAIYNLTVDANGQPTNTPLRLGEIPVPPWGLTMYTAPDGARAIFVDGFGNRNVFYPETGLLESVFRDNTDPMGLFFN